LRETSLQSVAGRGKTEAKLKTKVRDDSCENEIEFATPTPFCPPQEAGSFKISGCIIGFGLVTMRTIVGNRQSILMRTNTGMDIEPCLLHILHLHTLEVLIKEVKMHIHCLFHTMFLDVSMPQRYALSTHQTAGEGQCEQKHSNIWDL
jgi:hypothetical protein